MKKFPVVSIILAIVGLVLAGMASKSLEANRQRVSSDMRVKNRQHVSRLGLDKYLADLKWVRVIQQMGRVEGNLTERAANYFANEIDNITNLDPTMKEAYEIGVWQIASILPDRAIQLLEKANTLSLEKDWRWQSAAGYIAERYLKDVDKAQDYYKQAGSKGGQPSHVDRAWLRLASREAGEDHVKRLVLQQQCLKDLIKEIISESGGEDGTAEVLADDGGDESRPTRLANHILEQARSSTQRLLTEIALEKDAAKKEQLQKQLITVRNVFETMRKERAGSNKHVCENCLTPFGAGQFFCAKCGNKVAAFGHCDGCWKKGSLVLLNGSFCHVCGEKAADSK